MSGRAWIISLLRVIDKLCARPYHLLIWLNLSGSLFVEEVNPTDL